MHSLHALYSPITRLAAGPTADLDWEWDRERKQIFCFDFGLETGFDPFDEALFSSLVCALREFEIKIPLENVARVCLYDGVLKIPLRIEEKKSPLERTHIFSEYLHRLGANLPLEIPLTCHFVLEGNEEPALLAQQLSKRCFEHFDLTAEGHFLSSALRSFEGSVGLVLPQDKILTNPKIRAAWNAHVLQMHFPFRILPEELINQQWDGVDQLIVLEEGITELGERMLKGFEAAGGEIEKRKSE